MTALKAGSLRAIEIRVTRSPRRVIRLVWEGNGHWVTPFPSPGQILPSAVALGQVAFGEG